MATVSHLPTHTVGVNRESSTPPSSTLDDMLHGIIRPMPEYGKNRMLLGSRRHVDFCPTLLRPSGAGSAAGASADFLGQRFKRCALAATRSGSQRARANVLGPPKIQLTRRSNGF